MAIVELVGSLHYIGFKEPLNPALCITHFCLECPFKSPSSFKVFVEKTDMEKLVDSTQGQGLWMMTCVAEPSQSFCMMCSEICI